LIAVYKVQHTEELKHAAALTESYKKTSHYVSLDNDKLETHLLYLQYIHYNPLHVSSITCSSSGGWIVLMQHLVSYSQSLI